MRFETPANIVPLLDETVSAAAGTAFYRGLLPTRASIKTIEDFHRLPIIPITEFRKQRLADVITDTTRVQWIPGPYRGQISSVVPVAEGPDEAEIRYDLFADALLKSAPNLTHRAYRTCAVVASPGRRYYAAEISTILIYLGIPAHVFIDHGGGRTYERLRQISPDLLVVLSDGLDESGLPSSIQRCITFRQSHRLRRFEQLDMYVIDEFGFLGQSTDFGDFGRYYLNNDVYYFERSDNDRLVVTALYNRTQPLLRLETLDTVHDLGKHTLKLKNLCDS